MPSRSRAEQELAAALSQSANPNMPWKRSTQRGPHSS